jgi:hypothetical protein
MIITKIFGGLGNQMFQYAAGRALSVRCDTLLKLNTSYYRKEDIFKRKFGLNVFNIVGELDSQVDLGVSQNGHMFRLIEKFKPYFKRKIVNEQSFAYDINFNKIRNGACLNGYWQSEKYFKSIESTIRNEFTPKLISSEMSELIAEIESGNSIAVHVRRADYINFKHVNDFHGTCSVGYYHTALNIVSSQVISPHYYIFSDDQEWATQNLTMTGPATMVSALGFKDWEELILMSKCRHNIIANSTFSWWGAWLNDSPNKIVVAPKKWFNDGSVSTVDLTPNSWLRI